MFEPIGGSAPNIRGRVLLTRIAAISAAQLMLETLARKAAQDIEQAVIQVLAKDLLPQAKMGYSTSEVGDLVVNYINVLIFSIQQVREKAMKEVNVAVVGATGAVGNQMIACLEERQFPLKALNYWLLLCRSPVTL